MPIIGDALNAIIFIKAYLLERVFQSSGKWENEGSFEIFSTFEYRPLIFQNYHWIPET